MMRRKDRMENHPLSPGIQPEGGLSFQRSEPARPVWPVDTLWPGIRKGGMEIGLFHFVESLPGPGEQIEFFW